MHGSENDFCDDNGICTCKAGYTGDKCDQCADGTQDCFAGNMFTKYTDSHIYIQNTSMRCLILINKIELIDSLLLYNR